MAAEHTSPEPPQRTGTTAVPSLRLWGLLVLILFLVTSVVGGSLASESSYLAGILGGHIGLAVVTLLAAGYATSFAGRRYRGLPRASAGLAALSALGATIAGTVFLVGNQSNGALYAMEGFAFVGILSALVMIAVGSPSGKYVRSSGNA